MRRLGSPCARVLLFDLRSDGDQKVRDVLGTALTRLAADHDAASGIDPLLAIVGSLIGKARGNDLRDKPCGQIRPRNHLRRQRHYSRRALARGAGIHRPHDHAPEEAPGLEVDLTGDFLTDLHQPLLLLLGQINDLPLLRQALREGDLALTPLSLAALRLRRTGCLGPRRDGFHGFGGEGDGLIQQLKQRLLRRTQGVGLRTVDPIQQRAEFVIELRVAQLGKLQQRLEPRTRAFRTSTSSAETVVFLFGCATLMGAWSLTLHARHG